MKRTCVLRLHRAILLIVALLVFIAPLFAASGERKITQLAEGVYAIEHENLHDGNVNGNTTIIIGDHEVFVVDSCYRPSYAREDIAQIRQWTDKPVGYLLNTHFHNDHNNGNKTYRDAFPSIAIIAQEETKKDMDLIQPGNIAREPKHLAAAIAAFKQGKDQRGRALTEDEKKEVQALLPSLEKQEAEYSAMVYQPPDSMFTDKLEIDCESVTLGAAPWARQHSGRCHRISAQGENYRSGRLVGLSHSIHV